MINRSEKKYATAYETKIVELYSYIEPCCTIFLRATLSGVNYSDRSSYQLRVRAGARRCRFMRQPFLKGRLEELTYVRLLHVVHGPLRATFMPRRQYSSLDAARAVMSRWWNYVIGPRGALPILPLLQLLPRLPEGVVLLSARVSIWEHIPRVIEYRRRVWDTELHSNINSSPKEGTASLYLPLSTINILTINIL